jgi:hypothetical protein
LASEAPIGVRDIDSTPPATTTVHGHTGDAFGPARRQHRGAADVEGLLAGLHDTSPDDVVDDRRVDACALGKAVEHLCR